ncbi:MAG: rRNA pseudouridine synthase [Desulfovibrionaceae bacterium]|nr:rRNA pseudouridine synthase [Desulfovibrionaceae bacterium]
MKKTSASIPHIHASGTASPRSIRLNKALADAGVCSRRKADELIRHGSVAVNGTVTCELGLRVMPSDTISVYGKAVHTSQTRIWLLMNKPVHVVSTVHDPEGRRTVLDVLPEHWRKLRLFPVGRLDYFSEGALLLTNDGDMAHKVLHPRHQIPKVYHLLVRELPDEHALQSMRAGMRLAEGERLAPLEARILPSSARLPHFPPYGTLVELILTQGVNRQIRRMCRDLKLTVLRLARVAHGAISLGSLPPGSVRVLSAEEIASLRSEKSWTLKTSSVT